MLKMLKILGRFFGFQSLREYLFTRLGKLFTEHRKASTKNIYRYSYDKSIESTYSTLQDKITSSLVYSDKYKVRDYVINIINEQDNIDESICLEFGVRNGLSINYFSKNITSQFYGFDTFNGIPDDWLGTSGHKGSYSAEGVVPKVNKNVSIVKGLIEDTLVDFLINNKKKISFIHVDVDIYNTSKFILEKIKDYIHDDVIILFDDFCCFPGWKNGEYKALNEVFDENKIKYIAFGGEVCLVKIIGNQ